jgi:hypothetical protein
MLSRLAGRAVTGPLAFLAAGLYDFSAFFLAWGRMSLRQRLQQRRSDAPPA